jgi:hypothetical protein
MAADPVRDGRFIVNTVAGMEHIGMVPESYINGTLQDINKFFAFMGGTGI